MLMPVSAVIALARHVASLVPEARLAVCRAACVAVSWAVLAAAGLGPAATHAAAAAATTAPGLIDRAEVSHDAGSTWLPVALPDNWAQRNPVRQSRGRYRLHFALAQVPAEPVALAFTRLGTHRSVWLNGQLLQQLGDGPGYYIRRGAGPALLELPPALLRTGPNTLEIDLWHIGNGGLPVVQWGDADNLRLAQARREWVDVALPQALNMASLGLALFMLTVWLRRRSEVAVGCFGALALLAATRNLAYFSTVVVGPVGLLDWFFYVSQVFTAVLLGQFALAMAGDQPAYRRGLWALALVLLLLAVGAAWHDYGRSGAVDHVAGAGWLAELRRTTYPVLILATLPGLFFMLRLVRGQPRRSLLALAVGVGALVTGGVHDYGVLVGQTDAAGRFVLPYVFPLVLGAMSVFLIGRMVAATGAAEQLAQRLDERVAQRTRELAEANAAKARFLGAASHDLRQPVLTIGLLVSLLRDHVATAAAPAALADLVERLRRATASMESLLHGLMDLSRLDSALAAPRLQPVPLQSVFNGIAHHEDANAQARGLRLRFRPTPLVVHTDRALLEQALRNLVGNALRYTPEGGVLVVARRCGPAAVRVQVWDTGVGIAPEMQARVFEEFVQLHNPGRDRQQGLGLGLAIVQRCARALGTAVTVRSVPGRGSCFGLVLPLAGAAQGAGEAPEALSTAALRGLSLWLLEDDDDLRHALVSRLQGWGMEVLALSSANQARGALRRVAAGQQRPPHLLLSDQRLADGAGTDVIGQVRAQLGRALPCVLMTGDLDTQAGAARAHDGIPVLTKPFDMDLLRGTLLAARQGLPVPWHAARPRRPAP